MGDMNFTYICFVFLVCMRCNFFNDHRNRMMTYVYYNYSL